MGTTEEICAILTLVICGLGLVGNVLSGVVLWDKDLSSPYVYPLLGLTFSDILLLALSSIRTLINVGILHINASPSVDRFIFLWDWICTAGMKYFTVAISLERMFVVTYPLVAHNWLTTRRSKMCSLGVFLFVVCLTGVSFAYHFGLDQKSYPIYAVVVLHFAPFLLVVLSNVFIFIGLQRVSRKNEALSASEASVTRMLLAVVGIFGFCSSFEIIRQIMIYAYPSYMSAHAHYDYLINILADIFYVFNSSVNFVIYCLLGSAFRSVFFKGVKRRCCWARSSSSGAVSRHSSTTQA